MNPGQPKTRWARCKRFATLLLLFLLVACDAVPRSSGLFASFSDVLDDIKGARSIVLSAYTLQPKSAIVTELRHAGERGAAVDVVLTGDGFNYATAQNCDILKSLTHARVCQAGVPQRRGTLRVTLTAYPLHMKALLADADVIVTDTNFAKGSRTMPAGLFVRLPFSFRPTVLNAIQGEAGYLGPFTTSKELSLQVEATALATSTEPITIETESFTEQNPVFNVLLQAAPSRRITLVVNASDASTTPSFKDAADKLVRAGALVYLSSATEKIATTGATCWVGSSNASKGLENQIDWGLRIDNASICQYLTQRIDRNAGLIQT